MELSIGSLVRFGWETFKSRPWIFVGTTALLGLLLGISGSVSSGLDALFSGSAEEPSLPGTVFGWATSTLISMGATAFYLAAHDNSQTAEVSMLWHPQKFWSFLGASLLVSLAVLVGMILLIVPGVIFALMFMFATMIIIDRGLGPIEAMKESRRITSGYRWKLLGLALVLMLLNLAGLLALVVSLDDPDVGGGGGPDSGHRVAVIDAAVRYDIPPTQFLNSRHTETSVQSNRIHSHSPNRERI
jgi:hypothetical protein